jgi:hypothetical protein
MAHWGHGTAKVRALVAGGATLAVATERVARAALERVRAGGSSTFGFALQDCAIGAAAEQRPAARGGRLTMSRGTTAADFETAADLELQLSVLG